CWQGIPRPKKELLVSSNLEFIILIALGKTSESLHRSSVSEFKRKSIQEISDVKGADELLEAARLAPSAGNGQPWFFTGNENIIHAYSIKPGFIRGLMAKKYIPIDVGIALCHLNISAEHHGKKTEIKVDKTAPDYSDKGYEYVISLMVKN
ncbi:MAG: nitroreductase family protein, partial [Methanobacterium sp.]